MHTLSRKTVPIIFSPLHKLVYYGVMVGCTKIQLARRFRFLLWLGQRGQDMSIVSIHIHCASTSLLSVHNKETCYLRRDYTRC